MQSPFIDPWTHNHIFLGEHHSAHERRTWSVVALTTGMMIAEIVGGTMFGSIALVADGWHMGTHVTALAIAGLAYLFARRHAEDTRFSLGTGKFGELAAFSSAIILGVIGLGVAYESFIRLLNPVAINFRDAIPIAVLGLCVNLASAWLLRGEHHGHSHGHDHGGHAHDHSSHDHAHHDHDHGHDHDARRQDINLRAAYVHVLADALISVLTIAGLSLARAFGWNFMDPLVGLVGAAVIVSWSYSLLCAAGCVLLDTVPDPGLTQHIRSLMEQGGDHVCDLHVWQVGPGHLAVMVSIVSAVPQEPAAYKRRLSGLTGLSHVTVEVHGPGAEACVG
ncbi:MAG TPA: CDF family Co(II)/Ni(II) efflux transporter DmeF [Xanthobacteraceae bacterium]|jgi:cation diffusion facilitator family transporter|nr:CDF family Co(II)/Ni(II) efflux transporter DmeF [Xanthobacteraceae bacterium]